LLDFHEYKKLLHKLENLESEARKRGKRRGSDHPSRGPTLIRVIAKRRSGKPGDPDDAGPPDVFKCL